ncbi:MAG: gephyrin-like molybdotransferase Glp [Dehalococcoidales bacterium]
MKMKPFGALLPYEEALKTVLENVSPLERVEEVPITAAMGRVLARDIIATHSTPPFDRAAMDGYAVKARDTFGASRRNARLLTVIDVIYAGMIPQKRLAARQCIQIATGAKMPAGADAVVMVEDTDKEGDQVKIMRAASPRSHVSDKGEDIKQGELVLAQGVLLDPGKIGVLASQGMKRVTAYAQPQVAVLPTGEEVGEVGRKLKPGQVYDINSYTISAVVVGNGGQPFQQAIAGDTREELRTAIDRVLEKDIVVISGGSSVGERDLLFSILEEQGRVLFHGIQIKPGKPTLFALVKGKPVFGMPGYPTSCLVNAYLLLLPALRKMAHLPLRTRMEVATTLSERVPGSVGRLQFLPVRIEGNKAIPIFKESGAITTTAQADGYIEIAQNIDMLEKDAPVTVTLF